jgi:hypothetical protein
VRSRAEQLQGSGQAQLQGLFGTLLLVFGLAAYVALQNAAAYAERDGVPLSIWQVYLAPALFLLGSVFHYWAAIYITRGGPLPLSARIGPISIAGALILYRLF